jgi:hypothetical protein
MAEPWREKREGGYRLEEWSEATPGEGIADLARRKKHGAFLVQLLKVYLRLR